MVIGHSSDAGKPGLNPVEGSINKSVKKCVCDIRSYFVYMCVQFFCSIMLIFRYNIAEEHSGFLP